ncbi:hypothetical protein [Streptomyces sp. NBC_01304]|uniref:hypothetical protein n=1 Tax=Streptomyces sp. NBC_01304 TaxID=2903818 RepID=UPI002E0E414C|nr:hypothetical protein OG430_48830 [Streptomyces sp. NBC_01304]
MSLETLPLKSNGHLISPLDEVRVYRPGGDEEPVVFDITNSCDMCGEWLPEIRVTADAVELVNPCPYAAGVTTEITLSVPSGKLVVADDLSPIYDWRDKVTTSYGSAREQEQAVAIMAAAGCAFGPVGNSCPGLYRTGPDEYVIASGFTGGQKLAVIGTDIWTYSIADFEDWKARGGDAEEDVVDVRPGTYRFVHHFMERQFDGLADTAVFAHIERLA